MTRPLQAHQLASMTSQVKAGVPLAGLSIPAPKPRRRNEESEMQRALLKWWQLNCRHFGVSELLLFSIPNGGGRSGPKVGAILKAEGLRKGAPDLCLAVPKRTRVTSYDGILFWHSLFLELKTPKGVLSPEQEVFHEVLRKQGYRVEVIRSLVEGINCITTYLTK